MQKMMLMRCGQTAVYAGAMVLCTSMAGAVAQSFSNPTVDGREWVRAGAFLGVGLMIVGMGMIVTAVCV